MKQQRSLGVQAFTLAIGLGLGQAIIAVLYIVTARSMGPAEYGLLVIAITLGIVGAGLVDLGATQYWIRELASDRITQKELNSRMATRLYIVLVTAVIVTAIAMLIAPRFVATGVILFTHSAASSVLVPLSAERKTDFVGWLMIFGRIMSTIAFFGLLSIGAEPGLSLWTSMAFGNLLLMVSAHFLTPSEMRLRLQTRPLCNPWSGAKWYLMMFLGSNARQLDLPIVGSLGGASAAGLYAGVNRWTQPLVLGTSAFTWAAAPFLARETKLGNLRGPVLRATPILAVPFILCIGLMFAADWLVVLILGEQYAGSGIILKWLAGSILMNIVAQPMLAALQARRFDRLAALVSVVSVGAQLATVAVLAPTIGALSAGVGNFVGRSLELIGVAACVIAILWRRKTSIRSYLRY